MADERTPPENSFGETSQPESPVSPSRFEGLAIGRLSLALLALLAIYWEIGWSTGVQVERWHHHLTRLLIAGCVFLESWTWWRASDRRTHFQRNRIVLIGIGLLPLAIGLEGILFWDGVSPRRAHLIALILISSAQGGILLGSVVQMIQRTPMRWLIQIHPGALALLSFTTLILVGALLLGTPNACPPGTQLSPIDALFMATSAVCVTGLSVVDTQTELTRNGQLILLVLIQIGGLGVMTLAYLLALVGGSDLSLSERVLLRDLVNENRLSEIRASIARIVGLTLLFEGIGFLALRWTWARLPDVPSESLTWDAAFHAISAYCNAGFSTFSENLAAPGVRDDGFGLAVIAALIVAGGLGIPVWLDLARCGKIRLQRLLPRHQQPRPLKPRLRLHSRIVLQTNVILFLGGGLIFWIGRAGDSTLLLEPIGTAVFDSITARTAGFNIRDLGAYAPGAILLFMILMFVGGSPGGTAGGVKTTTLALMTLNLRRVLREEPAIVVNRRRLEDSLSAQAFAIVTLGGVWIVLSSMAIQVLQPRLAFLDVLFEAVSAFATVGLSRGVTAECGTLAKLVLIANMLAGRIGILLLFRAFFRRPRPSRIRYPEEPIFLT